VLRNHSTYNKEIRRKHKKMVNNCRNGLTCKGKDNGKCKFLHICKFGDICGIVDCQLHVLTIEQRKELQKNEELKKKTTPKDAPATV